MNSLEKRKAVLTDRIKKLSNIWGHNTGEDRKRALNLLWATQQDLDRVTVKIRQAKALRKEWHDWDTLFLSCHNQCCQNFNENWDAVAYQISYKDYMAMEGDHPCGECGQPTTPHRDVSTNVLLQKLGIKI